MCLLLKYLSASDTLSKYNRFPVSSFSATTGVFLALFVLSDAANTLLHSPVLIAWRALSVLLIHSKLEAELFSLFPSMWFTCGKFCGLSKNAFATSRCTLKVWLYSSLTSGISTTPLSPQLSAFPIMVHLSISVPIAVVIWLGVAWASLSGSFRASSPFWMI